MLERLEYNETTQVILEEATKGNYYYWRYQDASYNGLIPVNHKSHERMYTTEDPEFEEEGISCFDNPLQLFSYLINDGIDLDGEYDVVLFTGNHVGYGLDEEDIVELESEEDLVYVLSLKGYFKFCANADLYIHNINLMEKCNYILEELNI